jgi:hypothetical protein
MPANDDPTESLLDAMTQFVGAFEVVFQADWPYTLSNLKPGNVDGWIAPGHDFLDPGLPEPSNWGARVALLGAYRRLVAQMEAQNLPSWRPIPDPYFDFRWRIEGEPLPPPPPLSADVARAKLAVMPADEDDTDGSEVETDAEVSMPPNPLSRDELIDLVPRILARDAEVDAMIARFAENLPYPPVARACLFYALQERTPEQIVEQALNYRPDTAEIKAVRARMRKQHEHGG